MYFSTKITHIASYLLVFLNIAIVVPLTYRNTPKSVIKVCQHKNCMKQFPNGNLIETFQNLIEQSCADSPSNISIESSGCLSGCGKGPNVNIEAGNEKDTVFGDINDPFTAALLIEAQCSHKCHPMLIAACDVIAQSRKRKFLAIVQIFSFIVFSRNNASFLFEIVKSTTKKIKFLSSVISSLSGNSDLAASRALVTALLERAEIQILDSENNKNLLGAIDDCNHAIEIDANNGRAWKILAEALELDGDTLGALDAVSKWAEVDVTFQTKARNEIIRLKRNIP